MQKIPMIRVNKNRRCPVCDKPDWCLIAEDMTAAICARIEAGSRKRCGDAGWLHVLRTEDSHQKSGVRINDNNQRTLRCCSRQTVDSRMPIDFAHMAEVFASRCSERQVRCLADSLSVTHRSLKRLGIGLSSGSHTFPMRDERGHIIGIRRRLRNGRKNSVKGSKNGLFIPAGIENAKRLIICEGPTDCAAALDLGYAAIGRPNCNSRIPMTVAYVRGRPVVIVADHDTPGVRGARKLAEALVHSGSPVRIILPPLVYKDLRQWKENAGEIDLWQTTK